MTKKILVVEDEKSLREALQMKLESEENFEVIGAKNGKEGIEMALQEKPDLILLDIVMPKMNGLVMLKELRKDKWGKSVKVIVLTNLNDINQVEQAMSAGVYDYLVKSDCKIEDIMKMVKKKLNM